MKMTDGVCIHVSDSADRRAVRVQRIGDEVFLLSRADRYAPWNMNIEVSDIDKLDLVIRALREYGKTMLTDALRASVNLESERMQCQI